MAWRGEAENSCYGIAHKAICPLLKQWRQVAKGKATAESAGLQEASGSAGISPLQPSCA